MAAIGRRGAEALDRRIALAAGISADLPPEEYARRLRAARRAHYTRLSHLAAQARAAKGAPR